MLTFEMINKKRRPIKAYSFIGLSSGLIILVLIAALRNILSDSIQTILLGTAAIIFVISLFILSSSLRFKESIGRITFKKDSIDLEIMQKKEIIEIDKIQNIRFKLNGYEGLNKSTQPIYDLSYRSGINNFVTIQNNENVRKFEFYISNQQDWIELQDIVDYYKSKKINKT